MDEQRKQLVVQFMRLSGFFLRYNMQKPRNKGVNPYKGQGRILAILKMQPEIVQKELGYLLDISKQALAELLNKLEKKGYITRTKSKKDRRSYVIKLTDAGREAMPEKSDERDNDNIEEIFDCLSDEEQNNLINYMERIIGTIEEKIWDDEDSYASFFRKRFFSKHRHRHKHSTFEDIWGFNPHKFKGFRGNGNDE